MGNLHLHAYYSFILYTVKSGFPPPDAQNRFKIVFTTCTEEVCMEMSAKTKIKVAKLVGYYEEPATRRLQSAVMIFLWLWSPLAKPS
ncbi:hypothetical protein Bca4012_010275 [Brassica carinata]|uniref:Uncharacterized protein n=1 Tax=Brassica carinata TaxID=52824 RepID=A0A8X7S2T4_BRACI|nr:hypothetical protein Bca52824_035249 [Brassica carinata]